jgi:hypothetical protein
VNPFYNRYRVISSPVPPFRGRTVTHKRLVILCFLLQRDQTDAGKFAALLGDVAGGKYDALDTERNPSLHAVATGAAEAILMGEGEGEGEAEGAP